MAIKGKYTFKRTIKKSDKQLVAPWAYVFIHLCVKICVLSYLLTNVWHIDVKYTTAEFINIFNKKKGKKIGGPNSTIYQIWSYGAMFFHALDDGPKRDLSHLNFFIVGFHLTKAAQVSTFEINFSIIQYLLNDTLLVRYHGSGQKNRKICTYALQLEFGHCHSKY